MDLTELRELSKEQADRLRSHHGMEDEEKAAYAHVAKLAEETGELAEKVLGKYSVQRKQKLPRTSKDLPEEFADVIFTTTIFAESMGVDIEEALRNKIKKVKARKL